MNAQEIAKRAEQNRLGQEEAERLSLQMQLFPTWDEDRRGAPTTIIRSGIFGVVGRGSRLRVEDLPVAGNTDATITITGWRLDQEDFDVWLEIMHLARRTSPGTSVRFSLYWMLQRLDKRTDGDGNYQRLRTRLKHLAETSISYDSLKYCGVAGTLLADFHIDKTTRDAVVATNPKMRPLFESFAWLDVEQRRSLGQNQLAKWMHAALAAHPEWSSICAANLMPRTGAHRNQLRDFTSDLRAVLEDFKRRGWIRSFKIGRGPRGLVAIDKVPTPTQERALARRRTERQ